MLLARNPTLHHLGLELCGESNHSIIAFQNWFEK